MKLTLPLVVALLSSCVFADDKEKKEDAEKLLGTWKGVHVKANGRGSTRGGGQSIRFGPGNSGIQTVGEVVMHFRYKVLSDLKRIDVTIKTVGHKGGKQHPIREAAAFKSMQWKYALEGSKLRLTFNNSVGEFVRAKELKK